MIWSPPPSAHSFRSVHITTKATVCTAPASSPPPATSFTSACTISRVTVSLALRVRGPIMLTCMERSSEGSVGRILKTLIRSTEINSSSRVNRRDALLLFLVKTEVLIIINNFYLRRVVVCTVDFICVCTRVSCSAARGENPHSAAFPQQPGIPHKFC